MAPYRNSPTLIHEDADLFREAVLFTAGRSGLSAVLVEKDYYCSVLLTYLYQLEECPLVFRGGTSLSKIYAGFYRLSEDLDFVIPISSDAPRSERRRAIEPVKKWVTKIPDEISGFELPESEIEPTFDEQLPAALEGFQNPGNVELVFGLHLIHQNRIIG